MARCSWPWHSGTASTICSALPPSELTVPSRIPLIASAGYFAACNRIFRSGVLSMLQICMLVEDHNLPEGKWVSLLGQASNQNLLR